MPLRTQESLPLGDRFQPVERLNSTANERRNWPLSTIKVEIDIGPHIVDPSTDGLSEPTPLDGKSPKQMISMNQNIILPSACKDKLCTWDLSKKDASIVSKIMTAKNMEYLIKLKAYDYKIRQKKVAATGKTQYMYVWKHKGGCNKEFDRSWNLLDHCRMHAGIKPHQCHICDKKFTQKGNLNKHLVTHTS